LVNGTLKKFRVSERPDFGRLEFKGQRNVDPFRNAMKELADQQRSVTQAG
jgi:hypothetical protein